MLSVRGRDGVGVELDERAVLVVEHDPVDLRLIRSESIFPGRIVVSHPDLA